MHGIENFRPVLFDLPSVLQKISQLLLSAHPKVTKLEVFSGADWLPEVARKQLMDSFANEGAHPNAAELLKATELVFSSLGLQPRSAEADRVIAKALEFRKSQRQVIASFPTDMAPIENEILKLIEAERSHAGSLESVLRVSESVRQWTKGLIETPVQLVEHDPRGASSAIGRIKKQRSAGGALSCSALFGN